MISEDDDDIGYWVGDKPRWWAEQPDPKRQRPAHGGYPGGVPGLERLSPSLTKCWNICPAWMAAEIQQAAFLMHQGYANEAEQHRIAAGYGGFSG